MLKRLGIVLLFLLALWCHAVNFAGAAAPDNTATKAGDTSSAAGTGDRTVAKPEQPAPDPWETIWSGQRDMLNDISAQAAALLDRFNIETTDLGKKIRPFEEDTRRLLVLANNFKNWPNPIEAVSRRITATMRLVKQNLEPLMLARDETQALLDRVSQRVESLPDDARSGRASAEMQAYAKGIGQAKNRLSAVLSKYNSALDTPTALLDRLQKTQDDIASRLPMLWKNYYLPEATPWLNLSLWEQVPTSMGYAVQGMRLRLPVELPVSGEQWTTAALRFALSLCFTSLVTFLLSRRLLTPESPATVRHIFKISFPCLCLGFAFLSASLASSEEFYRFLLALGNLSIIAGQIFLSWDMRRLKYPDVGGSISPFWRLMPLTFGAYILLYLPLVRVVTLTLWGVLVTTALIRVRGRRVTAGFLSLENGVLESEIVVLWLCVVLTLLGLPTYSMALYLLFVSFSLVLELCVGSMALISDLNGGLPSEGARAAVGHLLLALAAPVVLVAVVTSALLWLATLPGGLHMLREYLLKSVNVGETQFNVIQVLLIISVFYLSRTAVAMGTRLLSKLSGQGLSIDSTLIPPMQTAYTYAVWCIFSLFALQSLGMELRSLAMVAGGLSVGIGFGMQTIVNNFISGLILIFSRTLQAGDVVEVGGITGRVRKISVRATMVETYDNALIYVPNSEFVSSRLINWTRNSRSVRREVRVGVAYGSNTEQVMKVMLNIAAAHNNILECPSPSASFVDFGANTLDFILRFWVKDYDVGGSTASDIRLAIEKEFRKHGIEVAFPQMDIHIKEMPPTSEHRRRQWSSAARKFVKRSPRAREKTITQGSQKWSRQ
ncbi:MAG: mechanosensitive ion channel [Desulfovibrio sp.]|jgi:small-conductance mechanosensitive channel|nr:mechanosensitive ion channel [Desulfovibrio sp.]